MRELYHDGVLIALRIAGTAEEDALLSIYTQRGQAALLAAISESVIGYHGMTIRAAREQAKGIVSVLVPRFTRV